MNDVFIIGGSVQAHRLAQALGGVRVWLPEPERVPRIWGEGVLCASPQPPRRTKTLVVAPHPCDERAARLGASLARAQGARLLLLRRPPWRAQGRDRWVSLRHETDAARHIPVGARVLTTLGRAGLRQLTALKAHVLARRLGPPSGAFPLKQGRFLPAQGPFSVAQEIRFLRKERIDWLLLRNAGGPGGWPKLEAARHLGIRVAMVDRPRWPDGVTVTSAEDAVAWLKRQ